MNVIVCYAKCWGCQFDEHPVDPHTWMDEDDMESAKVPVPSSPEGWERLAAERPCGCWCMKKHRAATTAEGIAEGDIKGSSEGSSTGGVS